MTVKGRRSDAIDLLRAIAVLGTIFQHTYTPYTNPSVWSLQLGGVTIYPFVFNGWLGVNLFFILSGFVLYRPSLATDATSVWRYYRHRAWRLWPLLILFVFAFNLAHQGSAPQALGFAALYCTGLNNLVPSLWYPQLGVVWSLGVEILFSLLLPALLRVQGRFGFWRTSVSIIVFCLIYRATADALWFAYDPRWRNPMINPLKDNVFGRLDDFVIGMVAARLCSGRERAQVARGLWPALVALVAIGYGWNLVLVWPRTPGVSLLASVLHLAFSLSSLVVICRLYGSAWTESRWLGPLVVVGQMCFSIYLTHVFILQLSQPRLDMLDPVQAIGFFASTLLFSLFCFVVIEARGIARKPAWLVRFETASGIGPPR